jgi:gamma-glutamyl hydrolase
MRSLLLQMQAISLLQGKMTTSLRCPRNDKMLKKQCSGSDGTDDTVSTSSESVVSAEYLLSVDVNPVEEEIAQIRPGPIFGGVPVIGILSQPRVAGETEETEFVIAASYAKWIESAGARVLPIPWDATEEMARAIFPQINGLLLPGGNSILPTVVRTFWELANEANARGDFFPIWGTCMGYEYLLMLASGEDEFILEGGYDSHNVCWPVILTDEPSDLYAKPIIQDIVTNQPVTMNNHEMGISPEAFRCNPGLTNMFRVTSTNLDFKGRSFVSTIESKNPEVYPYYGVQYHPEKTSFEYSCEPGTNIPLENINHSADALYVSFHLAAFFVGLARKNMALGKHVYDPNGVHPLVYQYECRPGLKFQQYYVIPAVGTKTTDAEGNVKAPFLGKDFSWRLDDYLADHVGIYKTEYTDE